MEIPDHLRRVMDEHKRLTDLIQSRAQRPDAAIRLRQDFTLDHVPAAARAASITAYDSLLSSLAKQAAINADRFTNIGSLMGERFNPKVRDLEKQLTSIGSLMGERFNPTVRDLEKFLHVQDTFARSAVDAAQKLTSISAFSRLQEQLTGLKTPIFNDRFEQLTSISAMMRAVQSSQWESPILAQVRDRIHELVDEGASLEQITQTVKSSASLRLADAGRDWVTYLASREFLVQLFFFLFAYYLSTHDQSKSTSQFLSALQKHHEEEMSLLQSLKPHEQPQDLYFILRSGPLRAERSSKAAPISWVFPNQVVRLIRISKEWAYVEFFDNIQGVPRMGWMKKKNLNKPRHQPATVPGQ